MTAQDGESATRFEVARQSPLVVLAVVEGARDAQQLAEQLLARFPDERFVGILAAEADEHLEPLIAALAPVLCELIFTAADSPRAVDGAALAFRALDEWGVGQDFVFTVPRLDGALRYAVAAVAGGRAHGWDGTAILVPGSPGTVLEAGRCLGDSAGSA